jgi:hypothetical protein
VKPIVSSVAPALFLYVSTGFTAAPVIVMTPPVGAVPIGIAVAVVKPTVCSAVSYAYGSSQKSESVRPAASAG